MLIKIRDIKDKDSSLLFGWANDPETRNNSFNSKIITWEEHSLWFQKKQKDPNCFFYLFTVDEDPVGIVRIENHEQAIIGITVAPDYRGKGLGSKIIKTACEKYWQSYKNPIFAYIKETNTSSKRAFEKAGFKKTSDTIIYGFSSHVLKATKDVD